MTATQISQQATHPYSIPGSPEPKSSFRLVSFTDAIFLRGSASRIYYVPEEDLDLAILHSAAIPPYRKPSGWEAMWEERNPGIAEPSFGWHDVPLLRLARNWIRLHPHFP